MQMGDLQDKLEAKMKEAFLSLIPDEKWGQLINHYIGTHGEKILEPILHKALVPLVKERVDAWIKDAKEHLEKIDVFGPALSQSFEEACMNTSKTFMEGMAQGIRTHVLEVISLNLAFCTNCGKTKAQNANCPSCGAYS
jgi:hypothetical protein